MSHAKVTFDWADAEHVFDLPLGQIIELQKQTDAGPFELLLRIKANRWRVQDLRETIRLGLVGGGMEPVKALSLVRKYVDERPYLESVMPALRILDAALAGVKDEELPKSEAAEDEPQSSLTESSPSPSSTDGDRRSDIPHETSISSHSGNSARAKRVGLRRTSKGSRSPNRQVETNTTPL